MQRMHVTGRAEPDKLVLRVERTGRRHARDPTGEADHRARCRDAVLAGSGRLRAGTTHTLDLSTRLRLRPPRRW